MISQDSIPEKEQTFFVKFLTEESDVDTLRNYQLPGSKRESVFEGHALQIPDSEISPKLKETGFQVPNWMFFVFVIQLLFTAIVITGYRHSFFLQLKSAFSVKSLKQLGKEGNPLFKTPSLLLLFVYLLSMGVFGFISIRLQLPDIFLPDLRLFAFLIMIVMVFPVFKLLGFGLIGQISRDQKTNSLYISNLFVYDVFIGLTLIPFVFLFAYRPISEFFIIISSIVVILFILRALRGIYIIFRYAYFTSLYIILYLCTLEMVPVLLLVIWILPMTGNPV
ncbi:MAG: DUF4271 domain-containing protein [Bacteroidales bacterium]|nr:DUF4271 domain-containing protein [Bacteroidales bacterium]